MRDVLNALLYDRIKTNLLEDDFLPRVHYSSQGILHAHTASELFTMMPLVYRVRLIRDRLLSPLSLFNTPN